MKIDLQRDDLYLAGYFLVVGNVVIIFICYLITSCLGIFLMQKSQAGKMPSFFVDYFKIRHHLGETSGTEIGYLLFVGRIFQGEELVDRRFYS